MTVGEWIKGRLGLWGFQYFQGIELDLLRDDLSSDDEMSDAAQEKIEVRLLDLIPVLMAAPKSVSENGFSITRQDLSTLYKFLLRKWGDKYGITDAYGILNTIEDVTDVW